MDILSPDSKDEDLLQDQDLIFPDRNEYFFELKKLNILIGCITDEMFETVLASDFIINSAGYHWKNRNISSLGAYLYLGPDYYLLSEDFHKVRRKTSYISETKLKICLFFGGSDVDNFTGRVIEIIADSEDFVISVITNRTTLKGLNRFEGRKNIKIYSEPLCVAKIMNEADIAITHGGNTIYEFAFLGVPQIVFCRRERQVIHAEYFEKQGVVKNFGYANFISKTDLLNEIYKLAFDRSFSDFKSQNGKKCVDGLGINRVYQIMEKWLNES
ncbi:MAG: glycosyltransferase [Rhodothermaceae bacterium]